MTISFSGCAWRQPRARCPLTRAEKKVIFSCEDRPSGGRRPSRGHGGALNAPTRSLERLLSGCKLRGTRSGHRGTHVEFPLRLDTAGLGGYDVNNRLLTLTLVR